jgi:hypothetical protein
MKEDMMRFLECSRIKGEIECEELKRLNRNKTFKICVPKLIFREGGKGEILVQ